MLTLETEIFVPGNPERVWDVLIDFSKYEEWHPLIKRAEGLISVGAELTASVIGPAGGPSEIRGRVVVVERPKRFEWQTGTWGLSVSRQCYQLIPVFDGTRVLNRQKLSGIWAQIFGTKYLKNSRAGFEASNWALRERVIALAAQ